MKQTYTAVLKQDGGWWIGWIEEVPGVNCQERTREELRESLRLALAEAIELSRAEAKLPSTGPQAALLQSSLPSVRGRSR